MPIIFSTLRQELRAKRRLALKQDAVNHATNIISQKILQSDIYVHSQNIACYIPTENEINTWAVIQAIWHDNKNCYLPIAAPNHKGYLYFVKFNPQDQLITSSYNVPEPLLLPEKIIAANELDLVIVPLVGFNQQNYRLGRGGGYYDRTFAFKLNASQQKPFLLGVGYSWQEVNFVNNPWDVPMDEIVTD